MRVVRRLGVTVRGAIADGMTLAGSLRRSAASAPQPHSCRIPEPAGAARPASAARAAASARRVTCCATPADPVRLARALVRPRPARARAAAQPDPQPNPQPNPQPDPQPVPACRPHATVSGDLPFTPETCPGLPPEMCAFLNTPAGQCDPDILRVVLELLARHIADCMPPELGLTDAGAVFSTFRSRFGALLGEAGPDAPPGTEQPAAPVTAVDAGPDLPPLQPAPLPEPQGTCPADDAAITARQTAPDAASLPTFLPAFLPASLPAFLPASGAHPSRSAHHGSRPFRHRRAWRAHPVRSCVRFGCSGLRRGSRRARPVLPPRRLFYAACAGPP